MDLCGDCLRVSEQVLAEDRYQTEAIVDFVPQEPPEDLERYFLDYCYDNGFLLKWTDGLGLMGLVDRSMYMYEQAEAVFLACIANGDTYHVARETALGTGPHRDPTAQGFQGGDLTDP
jgi:hypothetical protein